MDPVEIKVELNFDDHELKCFMNIRKLAQERKAMRDALKGLGDSLSAALFPMALSPQIRAVANQRARDSEKIIEFRHYDKLGFWKHCGEILVIGRPKFCPRCFTLYKEYRAQIERLEGVNDELLILAFYYDT